MIFDIITIFPDFFAGIVEHGLLRRAMDGRFIQIHRHDLRDFTDDRHRTVDDRPYGGGPGMVLMPEPIFRAVETIQRSPGGRDATVVLLSPRGKLLTQAVVEKLAARPGLILICGRYEGVDERVNEGLAAEEISIGDYVLSGGELAAAVVMESVTRLIPGALGNEESAAQESFAAIQGRRDGRRNSAALDPAEAKESALGLLDCPHYTRPAEFRGIKVPEVLLSGNHEAIRKWRRKRALQATAIRRPELLARVPLDAEDRVMLQEIECEASEPADKVQAVLDLGFTVGRV